MSIGIYKIENQINGRVYIGQSQNIERRWQRERRQAFLESDTSYNYPLSRAIRKYGLENFSFSILEICQIDQLNEREQFWMNKYNSLASGYNQVPAGSNHSPKGDKFSPSIILGVKKDLRDFILTQREIASKWNMSEDMVNAINVGKYHVKEGESYPLRRGVPNLDSKKYFCSRCGALCSKGSNLCLKCFKEEKGSHLPSREELKELIRSTPFTKIGAKYGVSDNAVRKWCDKYNLPRKSSEIKKISPEEWKSI